MNGGPPRQVIRKRENTRSVIVRPSHCRGRDLHQPWCSGERKTGLPDGFNEMGSTYPYTASGGEELGFFLSLPVRFFINETVDAYAKEAFSPKDSLLSLSLSLSPSPPLSLFPFPPPPLSLSLPPSSLSPYVELVHYYLGRIACGRNVRTRFTEHLCKVSVTGRLVVCHHGVMMQWGVLDAWSSNSGRHTSYFCKKMAPQ